MRVNTASLVTCPIEPIHGSEHIPLDRCCETNPDWQQMAMSIENVAQQRLIETAAVGYMEISTPTACRQQVTCSMCVDADSPASL